MITNPAMTCALVVAIDSYEWGTEWNLPGASIGASRFIARIRDQGVSKIHFYHGRSGEGGGNVPHAAVDDIRGKALLTDLKNQTDCDSLIIYWAGHGFERDGKRYVYLQDATKAVEKCFAVDEIIKFLNVETPHFTLQSVFFDTCAVNRSVDAFAVEPIPVRQERATPREDNHYFFAAATGDESKYPSRDAPSLFTQALLDVLDEDPLPNAVAIGDRLAVLIKGSHRIGRRDGRSPYWSDGGISGEAFQKLSNALELEAEALRIAKHIPLNQDDPKWFAAAKRIQPDLGWDESSLPAILKNFAGKASFSLAAELAVTLLLAVAGPTNCDIRRHIGDCTMLNAVLTTASARVKRLFTFTSPRYLVKTAYPLGGRELHVAGVWLSSMKGAEPVSRVFECAGPEKLCESLEKISQHMESLWVKEAVVCLVVPIDVLLNPPVDVLECDKSVPIIFRWDTRSERREKFRFADSKLHGLLQSLRRKVEDFGATIRWIDPNGVRSLRGDDALTDILALRDGDSREGDVLELLSKLVPFVAITRPSVKSLGGGFEESVLASALAEARDVSNFPGILHRARAQDGCLLSHLTIFWDEHDDVPLPKGYSQ